MWKFWNQNKERHDEILATTPTKAELTVGCKNNRRLEFTSSNLDDPFSEFKRWFLDNYFDTTLGYYIFKYQAGETFVKREDILWYEIRMPAKQKDE